jgi:hypothetical protein
VVVAFPDIAQTAAMEVARQDGQPEFGRGTMMAALWRTSGQMVGGDTSDASTRTLPVIDPELDASLDQPAQIATARSQRQALATAYLAQWNNEALLGFDVAAKMCQFSNLWRSFTCGYLDQLLNKEYPTRNLPQLIRSPPDPTATNNNSYLEQYFIFVGVAYWKQVPVMGPKIFKNPMPSSALTYAEVHLYIPRPRLVWGSVSTSSGGAQSTPLGGVPGDLVSLSAGSTSPGSGGGSTTWAVGREGLPASWDLLTQRWSCQLAPASQPVLKTILQNVPTLPSFDGAGITPPNLGDLGPNDLGHINAH